MKTILLTIILLLSVSSFAEVKPEWSIISSECGDNTSETMNSSSPTSACMGYVTGHTEFQTVEFNYRNGETKYFLITDRVVRMGATTIIVEEITVEKSGYVYLGDLKKGGEILELSTTFGFSGATIKGKDLFVNLELMMQTESISL